MRTKEEIWKTIGELTDRMIALEEQSRETYDLKEREKNYKKLDALGWQRQALCWVVLPKHGGDES